MYCTDCRGNEQGCVRGRLRRGHRAGQGVGRMRRYGALVGEFEYQGIGAEVCAVLLYFTLIYSTLLGSYTPLYVLLRVCLFVCLFRWSFTLLQAREVLLSFLVAFILSGGLPTVCLPRTSRRKRNEPHVQFGSGMDRRSTRATKFRDLQKHRKRFPF